MIISVFDSNACLYTCDVCLNSCKVSGNGFPLVSGNNRDIKPDTIGSTPITIRGSPKLQFFCKQIEHLCMWPSYLKCMVCTTLFVLNMMLISKKGTVTRVVGKGRFTQTMTQMWTQMWTPTRTQTWTQTRAILNTLLHLYLQLFIRQSLPPNPVVNL